MDLWALSPQAFQVLQVHRHHQIGIYQQVTRDALRPMAREIDAERLADAQHLFRTASAGVFMEAG
jgi:hypothetical protein